MRKIIALGIMLLFLGMTISSTGLYLEKQSIKPTSFGNTLYVGGNGTGNYTKIQDAIDDANDGDTVFVFNGTYYENIVIKKSINLIGENRDITIIDGNYLGYSISIIESYVVIKGFNIIHGKYDGIELWQFGSAPVCCSITDNIIASNEYSGVSLEGSYHNITNNIISNNSHNAMSIHGFTNNISYNNISNNNAGISIGEISRNNIISYNNIISNNGFGIGIYLSENNTINDNFISKNEDGIQLLGSGNTFKGNHITSNKGIGIRIIGIRISPGSINNTIKDNNITVNNEYGIRLEYSCISNIIYHNNFINNSQHAYDEGSNKWFEFDFFKSKGNYWDDWVGLRYKWSRFFPFLHPYRIVGSRFKFDWFPAYEPYDIEV